MRATERLYELWNLPPSGVERVQEESMLIEAVVGRMLASGDFKA